LKTATAAVFLTFTGCLIPYLFGWN